MDLLEEVGVWFDVFSHGIFEPDVLEGVIFEAEAVSDQKSAIREFAVAEVYLRMGLKVRVFSCLHHEVRVFLMFLLLAFGVVAPGGVFGAGAFGSSFVRHHFLVLSA